MPPPNFAVKLGQDEIGRILSLKEELDYWEVLEEAAREYCRLGWSLLVVDDQGKDLGIDFTQPFEDWSEALGALSWQETTANLAVRTGKASKLLVLEIAPGDPAVAGMDHKGWKADTIALGPGGRERHFFALREDSPVIPSAAPIQEITIYGDGVQVLVPPSGELEGVAWRWLAPPQEKPPRFPGPQVWRFLRDQGVIAAFSYFPPGWEPPSWEEIYRHISGYAQVLQALLTPEASLEEYYRGVAQRAWAAGLQDSGLLLGLLWHAPWGDARQNQERWEFLQQLANDPPRLSTASAEPDVHLCRPVDRTPEVWARFFQIMAELGAQLTRENYRAGAWPLAGGQPDFEIWALSGSNPWPSVMSWPDEIRAPGQLYNLGPAADLADGLMAPCQEEVIRFFLRNYICINPEWAGLPANRQLALAQRMAQEFLRH